MSQQVDQSWTKSAEEVLEALDVSVEQGLASDEAEKRREEYGWNRLRSAERRSVWQILLEQFKSLIVLLLAVAAVLSFAFGDFVEGFAVVIVIFINAAIGFVTELRAVRSMEALQDMGSVEVKVRREGQVHEVGAEKLVPGDIVLVRGGDVVTADLRLTEASKLQANESALTGESVPVGKHVDRLEAETPLAERANMLFKGTAVTRGNGEGVVVATGMETELGKISSLVEEAEEEVTPLEKRLDRLGHNLIWVTLGLAILVAVSGIISGKELRLMLETAVALAVASVPEGLPIVATVALARGMYRMARRNALVNRLSAVETLGATNVILTDKTGTLTENQMTVSRLVLASGPVQVSGEGLEIKGEFQQDEEQISPQDREDLQQALRVGVLCNNASLNEQASSEVPEAVGDPMEVALLVAGAKADMQRDALLDRMPEVREVAFDPEIKMMATFHESPQDSDENNGNKDYLVAVKGSPEAVLESCSRILKDESSKQNLSEPSAEELDDEARGRWLERNDAMAAEGLRVLALAMKEVEDSEEDPYTALTFLGLVGLLDPPREEVRGSIETCKEAGVRVVMATGDQPVTARNIAHAVGLTDSPDVAVVRGRDFGKVEDMDKEARERLLGTDIFARVNPEQKLDLIALHQDTGAIVAMTGDGVNDAPALKKADIGVAMGQRGTQVAREAADMVLEDDAFSSIVAAVEQGRAIFNNIRKFVLYLLSCNISEVLVVALASLINMPLPIRPLQILFLNLVTDVFPALALGVGEGDPHIMQRPPRDPDESIMTRYHWTLMGGYGMLITASVLGALALGLTWLKLDTNRAVTISFLTLALAQLWHVFNMRDRGSDFLNNGIVKNPYIWGAVGLCIGLLLLAVYVPFLADLLSIARLNAQEWALTLGMSLIPWVVGQVLKELELI
jgi:Ca2+-transporting ATPase